MYKSSDSHQEVKDKHYIREAAPRAKPATPAGIPVWPFAPGSQLGKQVARPWTPKPTYRFNQR
ncbi:MAG: hypothetical protein Q8M91_16925 [Polaromonas sp.]|nr:hypothetical protein [Polaromonas sp.]MDP3172018.1 hypothetical protein [Polaromonas sp.]MDP3309843.1 hypothetical protein [Polaromonas sp.]MDP3413066.1 hypothetical protein [Polaromonas sp.]MDP3606885.1 hypothetical protein [Polaromonas sp.]